VTTGRHVGGPFTYPRVGGTQGPLPVGYHHTELSRVVGRGEGDFARAGALLMSWDVHRRAGLTVTADEDRAAPGVEVVVGLGFGRLRVHAPCRVVYVIDEPRQQGFAYGTLRGHPETGEELFLVDWPDDDVVTFSVRAFSRPALWWSRLGGPVARRVQAWVTERYLEALVVRRG